MSHYSLHPNTTTFLQKTPVRMFIGGEGITPSSRKTYTAYNASEGVSLAEVYVSGEEEVNVAVHAAREAFDGWAGMSPAHRERLLRHLGDVIEQHSEELAQLESLENGKPIHQTSTIDVYVAAEEIYYFAGWPSKIAGETNPVSAPDHFVYTRREPLGVVAILIPWNYPVIDALQKASPALACGNTVILKPSSLASLAVLRLAELFTEAGVPPGVFNVVTGPGSTTGAALASHPGVRKVVFNGSNEAGRQVIRNSAAGIIRLSLNLGSKAPNCIFSDADLEKAVPAAFSAAFSNAGQSCVAGSRLYVQSAVHDRVVSKLIEMAKNARVGHAMDPKTQIGPIICRNQFETISDYIQSGISEGAHLDFGGERLVARDLPSGGYYLPPTIFTGASDKARITREEIFGPVLSVYSFESESELVQRANDTPFGMAAGLWTRDLARAHRLAALLKAGVVWVNTYNRFDASTPFGGFKHSGYGRDNSAYAIEELTEVKAVWIAVDE